MCCPLLLPPVIQEVVVSSFAPSSDSANVKRLFASDFAANVGEGRRPSVEGSPAVGRARNEQGERGKRRADSQPAGERPHTPASGSKWFKYVHNGVFQILRKLQRPVPYFMNSNGRFPTLDNYNGVSVNLKNATSR